jgi:4-hydroxy-2-oxoglutarate aldolase
MITPFREDGGVDFDAFARNIDRWNNEDLSGYLVLGSNSETPYLNEEEKLELIHLTVGIAAKGRTVLAGTGLESTKETITITNKAARLGANAALLITPSFYGSQMTDISLVRHYTAIADAVDIPILIYNVPKFTHLNIPVDVVRSLSRHPNIIGMKDSMGNSSQLSAIKNVVPGDFALIVGSASILYPALALGIKAGILALANCAPAECIDIQKMFDRNNHEEAKALQECLLPVNKAVTDTYGIAGLKYACTLRGYEGGFPRSPLLPLTAEQQASIRRILEQAHLLK